MLDAQAARADRRPRLPPSSRRSRRRRKSGMQAPKRGRRRREAQAVLRSLRRSRATRRQRPSTPLCASMRSAKRSSKRLRVGRFIAQRFDGSIDQFDFAAAEMEPHRERAHAFGIEGAAALEPNLTQASLRDRERARSGRPCREIVPDAGCRSSAGDRDNRCRPTPRAASAPYRRFRRVATRSLRRSAHLEPEHPNSPSAPSARKAVRPCDRQGCRSHRPHEADPRSRARADRIPEVARSAPALRRARLSQRQNRACCPSRHHPRRQTTQERRPQTREPSEDRRRCPGIASFPTPFT